MVALAGGGTLCVLGVREAVLLRDADLETARNRARQLGAARIGAGLALMARPRLLPGALRWDDGQLGASWLPRLVAVRELCLGIGTLASSRRDADPWPWLMTVAAVDGCEGVLLVGAMRRRVVDPAGAFGYVAADFGSAAAAVLRVTRTCTRGPAREPAGSR
jgi:hypothetical protein